MHESRAAIDISPAQVFVGLTIAMWWVVSAMPAVRVEVDDGALAAGDVRRVTGHVIERLLEGGVAIDPAATTRLTIARRDDRYVVTAHARGVETASAEVAAGGREPAVVELELVQVAVDLARAGADSTAAVTEGVHVVIAPGAAADRRDVLAAFAAHGDVIVPESTDAARTLCVDRRDGGHAVAQGADADACMQTLATAVEHGRIEDAREQLDAQTPSVTPTPAAPLEVPPPPREPVATPVTSPAAPRRRPRWSAGGRIGVGFAWRPRAVDAAPAVGAELASDRGLALGLDLAVLPTRTSELVTVDTQLAAGLGYRARLGRAVHLAVLASGGVSVHGARVGDERFVRVDPLLGLPIQLDGRVAPRVALGGRLTVATTLRARTHAIQGFEVWRRGAWVVMLAATVRFGR